MSEGSRQAAPALQGRPLWFRRGQPGARAGVSPSSNPLAWDSPVLPWRLSTLATSQPLASCCPAQVNISPILEESGSCCSSPQLLCGRLVTWYVMPHRGGQGSLGHLSPRLWHACFTEEQREVFLPGSLGGSSPRSLFPLRRKGTERSLQAPCPASEHSHGVGSRHQQAPLFRRVPCCLRTGWFRGLQWEAAEAGLVWDPGGMCLVRRAGRRTFPQPASNVHAPSSPPEPGEEPTSFQKEFPLSSRCVHQALESVSAHAS